MKNGKPMKYKNILEVAERVNELSKIISDAQAELDQMKLIQFVAETPEPKGFEYKEAIMAIFNKRPNDELKIDDIKDEIAIQYKFTPDRETVALRVSYLADNTDKLERVKGTQRGLYRLRKAENSA